MTTIAATVATTIARAVARTVAALGLSLLVAIPASAGPTEAERNKDAVRHSFAQWRDGSGGPFQLLAPDARWTITGSSPLSRTYEGRQDFLDRVIGPFNARMRERLVPEIRDIRAEGDRVVVLFDARSVARDGAEYRNTYSWHLRMQDGLVTEAVAFFDTRPFDALWARVKPE